MIVQDITEDFDIARRHNDDGGHPGARYQLDTRCRSIVVEQFTDAIVSQEVPREQQSLHVAVRRQADANYEGATIIVELVVSNHDVGRQNIELLVERISDKNPATRLLFEMIVLYDAVEIEHRVQFDC